MIKHPLLMNQTIRKTTLLTNTDGTLNHCTTTFEPSSWPKGPGRDPTNRKEWKQKYYESPQTKYKSYKAGAKERDYEFTISELDFYSLVDKDSRCTYCGASEKIGVDRVDNDIGYTLENCVSCCSTCNYAKRKQTVDQFLAHCKKVTDYQAKLQK